MPEPTRRALLSTVATATAGVLAGCSVLHHDPRGHGDSSGQFYVTTEFVPESIPERASRFEYRHVALETFRSAFPETAHREFGVAALETDFGVQVEAVTGVGEIEEGDRTRHLLVTGSFSRADVLAALDPEDDETHRDGDLVVLESVEPAIAIADGVLVASPDYGSFVDSDAGGPGPLLHSDTVWADAMDSCAAGTVSHVTTGADGALPVLGVGMDAKNGGDTISIEAAAHFESEYVAARNREAVRQHVAEDLDTASGVSIETVRADGSVIIVEGKTENFQF